MGYVLTLGLPIVIGEEVLVGNGVYVNVSWGFMLRLTRVEASVDLKDKGQGILEGLLQERRVLGTSAATPSNSRLL